MKRKYFSEDSQFPSEKRLYQGFSNCGARPPRGAPARVKGGARISSFRDIALRIYEYELANLQPSTRGNLTPAVSRQLLSLLKSAGVSVTLLKV